ncbi:ABC transporter substrate-binding protein [Bradyrhizobium sp. AUGA SZCCT0176]|uniref:TRAP transporter substrate-binding protein n=1 Tax=Bradyrhizobium sp. AUGA SZCCT0176 TaxID=2807664 RepID=UPI001BAB3505|nr:TRAP transporter substrate-binding protein [Bradyrhizobium sp. AUGA SZCCT0176]MBR1225179.1 ABC transporter substrate-binding protein [Bradyrhizobium sp. AUGA SZCCT0176]
MKRRDFFKAASLGVAAATVSSPALAQSTPELKWRLTSSFPKSLDTIFGASEVFVKAVAEATDNKFQIQIFAAGEIIPGLQALDAVSNGTVEMAHTATYYYIGKDPTFAFGTSVPFGLNSRMQTAWLQVGGGSELFNEFLKPYNVIALLAGNTGCQMGGWFRRELKEPSDLSGLKMRIGGFAGRVLTKLGVVPQQLAAGDIYPSLEKGTIDAAEWIGPYDDEKLGFQKVAKHYYFPGWWEGGPALHNLVNLQKWDSLPAGYRSIIKSASSLANETMLARYDAYNPPALKRLIASGTQLRPFPQSIMEASLRAANEVYTETSASNPNFKKLYEQMAMFRSDQYAWWQVAESSFDGFQIRSRTRN